MRKKTLLRPSPIRIPLRRMDNSTSARPRNKFWFAFLALFALWYLLLYDTDWSSFPGIKSISRSHTHSLRSLGFDSPRKRRFINGNNISKVDVGDISRNLSTVENGLIESVVERKQRSTKSCNGRYIYMHELPTRFNENVLKDCKSLSKWINMCLYLENMGLGPPLENPQSLLTSNGWFATDQFSLEIIFHNRMKRYKCLTNDSSEASAIYVPYYAGLDIARYLFDSHNISTKDSSSLELMKWLRSKPEWEKMWGKDHFMVVGRITWDFRRAVDEDSGWGNKLMLLPESQNMTMLTIESSPWHKNDFAIPYPTYFHPSNDNEIFQWQTRTRKRKRVTLFTFVGGLRPTKNNDVRVEIIKQCQASRRKCKLLECKDKSLKCSKPFYIMKMFQSSIFCLQPPGDSYTRRSTFDTILAGCIPVFFSPGSAYVQYLWHLPRDFSKYSVLIPEDAIKGKKANIENILSRIPRSKVLAMQEEVIKLIPKVVYANPMSSLQTYEDAFDLTIKGVVDRVEEFRQGKNSSFDAENSWKYYTFGNVGKHEWDHFFSKDRVKF